MSRDCLIQLISNGNKLIAENAHQCVIHLLDHIQSEKLIPLALDEMQSKNKETRQRVSYYLYHILKNYDSDVLERNT